MLYCTCCRVDRLSQLPKLLNSNNSLLQGHLRTAHVLYYSILYYTTKTLFNNRLAVVTGCCMCSPNRTANSPADELSHYLFAPRQTLFQFQTYCWRRVAWHSMQQSPPPQAPTSAAVSVRSYIECPPHRVVPTFHSQCAFFELRIISPKARVHLCMCSTTVLAQGREWVGTPPHPSAHVNARSIA